VRRRLRELVLVEEGAHLKTSLNDRGTVQPLMEAIRSLSIVVPVFNSENSLRPLVESLARELPALARQHEVILVNDGSGDRSGEVARELQTQYPFVRAIELMRNYGQHNALLLGVRLAQHDIVVTMDDDLEHPASEIRHLLAKLSEGYDVVYGVPQRQQHGLFRDLASQLTKLILQSAMGADTARRISAFRAFRVGVREAFAEFRGANVNLDVLLTWASTRFSAVVVRHDERHFGSSNYTLRKLIRHSLNMITGFSVLPLRLASIVGFASTFIGILILLYVLGRYLIQGATVPGFAFLASIIAIFCGAQMFAIGIIGEYLARIHFRLMDKPSYTVRTDTGLPNDSKPSVG
jgi:glycosyltransferase involved in cell wall biosynthesis